jgi:copper homeostasis protein
MYTTTRYAAVTLFVGTPAAHSRILVLLKHVLEISVESVGAAVAAERGGAHRLELCRDLSAGGITPEEGLLRAVLSVVRLPVFAMIRPRSGGFVYSDAEFAVMKTSIARARELAIGGIVLGILTAEHCVDVPRTRALVKLAAPLPVTFHRAFDVTSDLSKSLEDVLQTGATRILSSGGAFNALAGAATLAFLRTVVKDRIKIVPGTGINPGNIAEVARITGAQEFHSGLGSVLPYATSDFSAFQSQVQQMSAVLQEFA